MASQKGRAFLPDHPHSLARRLCRRRRIRRKLLSVLAHVRVSRPCLGKIIRDILRTWKEMSLRNRRNVSSSSLSQHTCVVTTMARSLRETPFFECFRYVCPVLVFSKMMAFSYKNGIIAKKRRFLPYRPMRPRSLHSSDATFFQIHCRCCCRRHCHLRRHSILRWTTPLRSRCCCRPGRQRRCRRSGYPR